MLAWLLTLITLHRAFILSGVYSFALVSFAFGQATSITPSGLNTQVSAPTALPGGQTLYNITGGTRPGNGSNLFHSFGNFSVGENNIGNFLNNSGLPTANILGRVTGGNVSNIFGTVQTTGFGGANLYLMNPAGFLFGPNATLNVGGMVAFTSADYLRLADNVRFNAVPNAAPDLLLSAAPVAAFGFLGSNPGAITVQGSHLTVAEGTGISLVGGDITVQGGTLTAPSGQITLVSVNRPSKLKVGGEVAHGEGFVSTGFKRLGDITLMQGSIIDTSPVADTSNSAGNVVIRGGQFVMDDSSIRAGVPSPPFQEVGEVFGGNVEVTAEHVALSNNSTIDTSLPRSIRGFSAGSVTFNADTFSATDSTISATVGFFSGKGGAVTIQGREGTGDSAHSVSLTNTTIGTSSAGLPTCPGPCNTDGGPILMRAHNIALEQSRLNAFSAEQTGGAITLVSKGGLESHNSSFTTNSIFGTGGIVDLRAGKTIDLSNTAISARSSFFKGGTVNLSAAKILLERSNLDVRTQGNSPGGAITLNGDKAVSLTDTRLSADNSLPADVPIGVPRHSDGGIISINAGGKINTQQSTISAQSAAGNGGSIQMEAPKVQLTDTQVTTSVSGGPETVAGSLSIEGNKVRLDNSQILNTATEGDGGTIGIVTHKLNSTNSVIDASSQTGTDGTVTIQHP